VASAGLPILLLKAPGIKAQGAKPRVGEFDYIDYVVKLGGRKSRVSVEFVEGADHSFANREGREAVERHIAGWLASHFPLTNSVRRKGCFPLARRSRTRTNREKVARGACRSGLRPGRQVRKHGYKNGSHRAVQAGGAGAGQAARAAHDDLALLDSGLDSLCFAIVVARLENSLGVDPFSDDEDARFPVTFGDFIRFYENAAS
jgi:hypothetical protein